MANLQRSGGETGPAGGAPAGDLATGATSGQPRRVDCTVVIVTYNNARDIIGLLSTLTAAAAGLTLRTIVVDNGSVDGTVQLVRDRSDAVCIETGANLGYAGGINIGRQHAGEHSALLVLNPDLVLEPAALAEMFAALKDPAVGIVVPMLLDGDGRRYPSLRREPTLTRTIGEGLLGDHFGRRPKGLSEIVRAERDYAHQHPVDWATGAVMLISAACDHAVGRWDERFFLYSEEVDYATRARAAGFRVEYVPAARAQHRGRGSGQSEMLVALMAVNRIRFMEKHRRRSSGVYRAAVIFYELLRSRDPGHRTALRTILRRAHWSGLPGGQRKLSEDPGTGVMQRRAEEN